jgi:hypothetical protein
MFPTPQCQYEAILVWSYTTLLRMGHDRGKTSVLKPSLRQITINNYDIQNTIINNSDIHSYFNIDSIPVKQRVNSTFLILTNLGEKI